MDYYILSFLLSSIQLAVDATLPEPFGGCGGHSIFIDTEGSFVIDRVVQIATATVRHVHSVAKSSDDPGKKKTWLIIMFYKYRVFGQILSKMAR